MYYGIHTLEKWDRKSGKRKKTEPRAPPGLVKATRGFAPRRISAAGKNQKLKMPVSDLLD